MRERPILDAKAEGVDWSEAKVPTYRDAFHLKWDDIYGADSWDANGWVWALTFKVVPRG